MTCFSKCFCMPPVSVFDLNIVCKQNILYKIQEVLLLTRSRGSSVSTVSDYGLDDRAIGFRSMAWAKVFSSNLCVQTGSEAHPASCTMGTGGPFHLAKGRPGRDADYSPPSSAEVKNE
jgi:hypothetical protein